MTQPFSFEKQYGANVETSRPVKVKDLQSPNDIANSPSSEETKSRMNVMEGYGVAEDENLTDLYNSMTGGPMTRRKYDMDTRVSYSRNHPEYIPDTPEKLMKDSEDVIQQQMMTMSITLVATASLAMIIFMVSTTGSST